MENRINSLRLKRMRTTLAGSVAALAINVAMLPQAAAAEDSAAKPAPTQPADTFQIDEVVVTGTNIRGVRNDTAPITTIDSDYIDRTGYASTQQLIDAIPQNFGGGGLGASEDGLIGGGGQAQLNVSSATAINLRGLGASSTLVLINGRRVAPSAFGGAVDVSLIPLGAIERVDVATDGASAVYGADAVAGVVNFTLRRDFEGADSRLRVGTVTDGSLQEVIGNQTFGKKWTGGSGLLSFQYRKRDNLSSAERPFTRTAPRPTDLLPDVETYTALWNVHHDVNDYVELFTDGDITNSDGNRNYTSIGQQYRTDTKVKRIRGNVGIAVNPFDDWRAELAMSYSHEGATTRQWFTPSIPGYTNGLVYQDNDFEYKSIDAKVDGSLFALPGGDAKIAFGGSLRYEDFRHDVPYRNSSEPVSRKIAAVFGEVFLPVVGEDNNIPLVRSLTVTGALRYDHYSDFGGTTNPRLGLAWSPVEGLNVRGSYSTSFRAPNAGEQLISGYDVISFPFADPSGGLVPVFLLTGAEPNLRPEESTSYTLGFDYRPAYVEGLTLSATYFNINYKDRLIIPPFDPGALLQPEVYGSLITPLADDNAALAFLNAQQAAGAIFMDLLGAGGLGTRYVYNLRLQNAAQVRAEGLDFAASYTHPLGSGNALIRIDAAYLKKIDTAFSSGATSTNIVNTFGNPLKYRVRADIGWAGEEISVNTAINFRNRYKDTSVSPAGRISSWTTFDLAGWYTPKAIDGFSVGLSVNNLFDKNPPYAGGLGIPGINYDTANADPLGRFIALELRQKW